MKLIALFFLLAIVLSPPSEGAPSAGCSVGYSATALKGLAIRGSDGSFGLADDLHLGTATDLALCSFDIAAENPDSDPHGLWVTFQSGGTDDPVPGGITAGPFYVTVAPSGWAVYHVNVPNGYVAKDAYISFQWDDSQWPGLELTDDATIGSSHDTFYFSNGNYFLPASASLYAVVQVGDPVPSRVETWGALKAHYR